MDIQQVVREVTVRGSVQGMDQVAAAYDQVSDAADRTATVTQTTTKAQASAEAAVEKLRLRYQDGYRQQTQYTQAEQTYQRAVNQGIVTQSAAAAELANIQSKLGTSQSVFEKGLDSAKDKAAELTRELGPMGSALTAIGPVGLTIGAGIGIAVLALDKLKDQANEAGRWAKQLQDAANVIGLDTEQLQALNEAGARAGVTAEDNVAAFEKFAVSLGQLKDGSGQLYTQLQKINPTLAAQLSNVKDNATGWNLLAQAYANADKTQQALLARAAFGRGGAAQGQVLLATAQAGGIGGLQAANEDAISKDQIQRWADLTAEINHATEAAQHNFQSIFTDTILTSEKNFADNMLSVSRYAKDFTLSEDWNKFVAFLNDPRVSTVLGVIGKVLIPAPIAIAASAVGSLFSKSSAPPSMKDFVSPSNDYSKFQQGASSPAANDNNGPGSPAYEAARLRDLVSALGSAATAQDHYNATVAASKAALEQANKTGDDNVISLARSVAARVQSTAALDRDTALQNAHNSALGQSASISDLVAAKANQIAKLQQQGAGLSEAQVQKQLDLTKAQALGTFQINAQTDAENIKIATLAMSTQAATAYQLVQTKINEAIALGKPLNADQIADLQKSADAFAAAKVKADDYTTAINDAKNAATSFATDFVQGMLSGKTAAEALAATLKSVGSTLVSSGIKNLIQGAASADPIQAAIGGVEVIGGAIAQYLGGQSDAQKALQDAELQWQRIAIDVVNFSEACKGVDLGPLTQEVQSLLSTYTQLQAAALKANDQAGANQTSIDFGNAVNRIVQQFKDGEQTLNDYQKAQKALKDEAQGLEDTLISLKDYTLANEVGISLQKQLDALAQQFVTSFTASLQARINSAQGKDYLNSAAALLVQHQQDILEASQLGISQTLVDSTFAAEAQKIVDDAGLVGDSFSDFIKLFPDFNGVVTESASALQAANDKFNQLTKTISDYLNSLALGSNSTLSPQQQLALAQSNFQQQYSQAAGGDQTALSTITQFAQTFLDQAKGFYASSSGYADVYSAVTSALQGLTGGSSSGSLGAPIGPSPLFSTSSSSAAAANLPGIAAPQTSTADNDNVVQYLQAQTTTLSQIFAQCSNAEILAAQAIGADLGARLDKIAAAIQASKPKPARPAEKKAA